MKNNIIYIIITLLFVQGCVGNDIKIKATEDEYHKCVANEIHFKEAIMEKNEKCVKERGDQCMGYQVPQANPYTMCKEIRLNERHPTLANTISLLALPITIPLFVILFMVAVPMCITGNCPD